MKYHVTIDGTTRVVEVDGGTVRVDGTPVHAELRHIEGTPVGSLVVDGVSHALTSRSRGSGTWEIHLGARSLRAEVVDERTRAIRAMTGESKKASGPQPVVAPMPGMVVRVEVVEGEEVREGQGVAIVEAMKMENELLATAPGIVSRVHVTAGEAVEKDQLLVELAPLPAEEADG